MKKILLFILAACLFAGCKTDEIDLFGEERYICFETIDNEYSISYTLGGMDEGYVDIPVTYCGRFYEDDREYALEVIKKEGTEEKPVINAEEGIEFELPEKMVFRASENKYHDVLRLKIKSSPRMDEEVLNICLRLVSNDNFLAQLRNSLEMNVLVTNIITKPSWWNEEVVDAYLGEYSDVKYKLFMENIYDGDYGKLTAGEKHQYAVLFKNYLQENPHYDNGKLITVPVIG